MNKFWQVNERVNRGIYCIYFISSLWCHIPSRPHLQRQSYIPSDLELCMLPSYFLLLVLQKTKITLEMPGWAYLLDSLKEGVLNNNALLSEWTSKCKIIPQWVWQFQWRCVLAEWKWLAWSTGRNANCYKLVSCDPTEQKHCPGLLIYQTWLEILIR